MTRMRGTLQLQLMGLCHSQVTLMKSTDINPLNAELNPICHLLALLGGATIVVVSRLRVNITETTYSCQFQYEFGNQ